MIELDDHTRTALRHLQRIESNKRRHVKITAILMLDAGFSAEDVAVAFGVDVTTIYRYRDAFINRADDDPESYISDKYVPYSGKLTEEQQQQLAQALREHLYTSADAIAEYVYQRFGVEYTPTGIVPLLHRLGFVYKKTRQVSPKANPEAQREFLEELEQILEECSEADAVYFCDGVHPQHNTRSSYGWIASGEDFEIPSNTGRERVNINAALNAHDVTEIVLREDNRINAESVIKLYQQLERKHPKGKITVICDNARYYRSRMVRDWVEDSRIRQVFLPSYSPNLNLIERVWKFMRKKILDSVYYPTREEFRDAIFTFFKRFKKYRRELETLLTLNFHVA